jgi:hypothetical protein
MDTAFFHLYLRPETEWRRESTALARSFPTPRATVSYPLDTFPIVKRTDGAQWGDYRTRRLIIKFLRCPS